MIAGGIVLIVIGFMIFGLSSNIGGVQSNNIQQCTSLPLTGQFSQSLSQNYTSICNSAPGLLAMANTGLVVAILMGVIGVVLIIVGAIQRGSPKTAG